MIACMTVAPSNSDPWNYDWQWRHLTVIHGTNTDSGCIWQQTESVCSTLLAICFSLFSTHYLLLVKTDPHRDSEIFRLSRQDSSRLTKSCWDSDLSNKLGAWVMHSMKQLVGVWYLPWLCGSKTCLGTHQFVPSHTCTDGRHLDQPWKSGKDLTSLSS